MIQLWPPCYLNVHVAFKNGLDLPAQRKLVSHLLRKEDELVGWATKPTPGQPPVAVADLYRVKGLRRNWRDSLVLQDKSETDLMSEIARMPTAQRLRQYFQAGNQRQPGRLYFAELNEDASVDLRYWPADLSPITLATNLRMAADQVASGAFRYRCSL